MKVWNVICPVCGFQYKSTELRRRWDGVYVCTKDWEVRHPLDFYNVKAEDTSVPYSYPDIDGTTEDTSGWVDTLTTVYTPRTDTLGTTVVSSPIVPSPGGAHISYIVTRGLGTDGIKYIVTEGFI